MIPFPRRKFACILADPPWSYKAFSRKGYGRSASRHYDTMTLADVAAMPVTDIAADDCHLFLWATASNLPQAIDTMAAWGFRYSTIGFSWVKLNPSEQGALFFAHADSFHVGMGHTTRHNVELCLLGRRGQPKRLNKGVRELIVAPRREHSRKPDEIHERIEAYCAGPRIELFARRKRKGWVAWGDQTDKFAP